MPNDATVTRTSGVSGGYPVIGTTRIPVRVIVEAYRETGSFERTVDAFPQLTADQVRAALEYYQREPGPVDEDIETNARALMEVKARRWPA